MKALARKIRTWAVRTLARERSTSPRVSTFNWEGVYHRFADVPSHGAGFENYAWIADTRRLTERALQECSEPDRLPVVGDESALLPILLAVSSASGTSRPRVLDFGGGMGLSYVHAIRAVAHAEGIEYHIVEKPQICRQGRELFGQDQRVHFHESLPETLAAVDIVYVNSALQYVEDYRSLLQKFCALSPRFILLARCSAGDIPTYATAQLTLPGQTLPYWFINVRELMAIFEQCGYTPVFMARGSYRLDQSNFEERYRIGAACNLLFARARGR